MIRLRNHNHIRLSFLNPRFTEVVETPFDGPDLFPLIRLRIQLFQPLFPLTPHPRRRLNRVQLADIPRRISFAFESMSVRRRRGDEEAGKDAGTAASFDDVQTGGVGRGWEGSMDV